MSLSEKVSQLNQEIGAALERTLSDLRREVSQAADHLRTNTDEVLRRLDGLSPTVPASFFADEDLAPTLEEAAGKAAAEAGGHARRGAYGELLAALSSIDRARSQADILNALLQESGRFASRTAVLLARGNEIRGWGSHAFGESEAAIRGLAFPLPSGGSWARLIQGEGGVRLEPGEAAELSNRIESQVPQEAVLVPLVLRDRVAAALYADRQDGAELAVEALQLLAYTAAQAIESLPFRERDSTATLRFDTGDAGAAAAAVPEAAPVSEPEPPAAEAPAAEPEPAPEAFVAQDEPPALAAEPEPAAVEPEPEAAPEPELAEASETPEATGAEATEAEIAWTIEEDTDGTEDTAVALEAPVEAIPFEAEPEPAEASWEEMPAPEELPELPEIPAEHPTQELNLRDAPRFAEPAAPDSGPGDTVLLPRSSFRDEPAPAPPPAPMPALRSVPPPPPASPGFDALRTTPLSGATPTTAGPVASGIAGAGGASPEVQPPSDVQGPGWAFATTRVPVSPNEEALHEEARRLARLLVSEIKLYNEEQVDEGRRNRDLYERLKEDIDRSRQMYEERVEPRILKSTDYFYQELVRILAAGDPKALGI